MILTVTPSSAVDRVILIEEFLPGDTMRAPHWLDCIGGKGTGASVVLNALRADTLAMSFVAGVQGHTFIRLLEERAIRHDCVWCAGETRVAHVLVETRHQRHSHITIGALVVAPDTLTEFQQRFQRHLAESAWVAAGGSLPAGLQDSFYADLVAQAHQAGVAALVDSYGEPMRQAVKARPAIVKMNCRELAQTFGVSRDTPAELLTAARELLIAHDLPALVVTCGGEGILAVLSEVAYLARSPLLAEVNAAGAGDAVTGALTWRLSLGDPWCEALRWAAAAAAAVVLTEGTAHCRVDDVQRIRPTVSVETLGNDPVTQDGR